jgi:hypothetical protein
VNKRSAVKNLFSLTKEKILRRLRMTGKGASRGRESRRVFANPLLDPKYTLPFYIEM